MRLHASELFIFRYASTVFSSAADRPNIIIIFTDDQGYNEFSCFGTPDISTTLFSDSGEFSVPISII